MNQTVQAECKFDVMTRLPLLVRTPYIVLFVVIRAAIATALDKHNEDGSICAARLIQHGEATFHVRDLIEG